MARYGEHGWTAIKVVYKVYIMDLDITPKAKVSHTLPPPNLARTEQPASS